eukprot:NODE_1_length_52663_cov_18.711648_g0_i0.p1 GENE.NODE_1_length_52663_cov_18.711648_g0_i0~~NODE_1_length_52663_cov_18.711648_g0_i0.p1  ORF type:complete len:880 (+),score=201.93 NODE_1_length_52663_cov_18.711648_g0_i0:20668-23307(+)
MATRTVDVKLSVGAIMAISEPLRRGAKDVGKFQKEVTSRLKKLDNIKAATRAIESFEKINEQRKANNEALDEARDKYKALHKEINAGGKVTEKQRKEYKKQRDEVERLEKKQGDLNNKVAQASRGLGEYGVSVRNLKNDKQRLAGEFDDETAAIKRNTAAYDANKDKLEQMKRHRKNFDDAMSKARDRMIVGTGLMYTGTRVMKSLWDPMQAAISAEEAFAEVRKVVDFAGNEEMKAFQSKIMDMSKKVPMSISQLYQLVAAAGQSGIPKDQLIEFTSLASRVGVAFDISADEAGDSLAGIRTALGLTIEETGLYTDAINHLSNNMASSAPDLLNFAQRTLGDFQNFGLAKEQALAFGAAMLAVKVPTDVAATSFRNMGKMLARGEAATKSQREGFVALGLSAESVSQNLQSDAIGTIFDVMERLKGLSDDRRATVQSQIFGDEARGIGALVQNADVLKEALGLVGDSDAYGGSAMGEYANRIDTTAAKMQIFQNQMDALKIAFAETLLPTLTKLVEKLGAVVNWMSDLAKEYPSLAEGLGLAIAAAGGLIVASGAAVNAIAVAGVLAALKKGGWTGLTSLLGDASGGFDLIGRNARTASGALDGYAGSLDAATRNTENLVSKSKGLVGKAGVLNAVLMALTAADLIDKMDIKPIEEVTQEDHQKMLDKVKASNDLAESIPLIGGLYRWTSGLRESFLGGAPVAPAGLAEKKEQLAELDRRIATVKQTALNPAAGNMLSASLQQERAELVAEIGKMSAGIKQSPVDTALREKADQIRAVRFPVGSPANLANLPGRAKGGPVKAGRAYMVGEQGPEPFVPNQSGTIIPNGAIAGSREISAVFNIYGPDPHQIAQQVKHVMSDLWREAGMNSYEDEDMVTT